MVRSQLFPEELVYLNYCAYSKSGTNLQQ